MGDLYQVLKVDLPGINNPQSDRITILSGEYGLFYSTFTKDYTFDVKASENFFTGSSVSQITLMHHNSTNETLSFLLTHAVNDSDEKVKDAEVNEKTQYLRLDVPV